MQESGVDIRFKICKPDVTPSN